MTTNTYKAHKKRAGGWIKPLITLLRLYPLAAALYAAYRLVLRPHTHGALVALWHGGRLLLVQASYRRQLSLPGGGIGRGETARSAAVRELAEELRIRVDPAALLDPWQITEASAGGQNTVTIFRVVLDQAPALEPDGLEIVACHWLSREEALQHPITSHLRAYLRQPGHNQSC